MNEHVSRSYRIFLIAVSAAVVTLSVICPARAATTTFKPPVLFERNDGQSDPSVLYLTHCLGYSLFLTRTGATIVLPGPLNNDHRSPREAANFFSLSFVGSNPHATISGVDQLPGKSNYFSGSDPTLWHTNIPQFAKVRYSNLYPGIDVLFYVRDGQLEYDIVAAPGADLRAIRVKEIGTKPHLTPAGDIALHFGQQQFVLKKPRVYQSDPQQHLIPTRYALRGNDLSFQIGRYDRTRPLIIDPALIFSTHLNSNCQQSGTSGNYCSDSITDIAADASGVYVTGSTTASAFPATSGNPAPTYQTYQQTFVLKINPAGTSIIYATYLSSSIGLSLTVDSLGSAYVVGTATVANTNQAAPPFPLTSGVFSGVVPANSAQAPVPFAAKLSANGASIAYSTLLQQSNTSTPAIYQVITPSKIAVDSAGALYITGSATPPSLGDSQTIWLPLPVTTGAFQTMPGSLFAMKLTPNASGVSYSTYIDGVSASDPNGLRPGYGTLATGIAADSNGDAFIAGSAVSGFPTTAGAYQTTAPDSTHNNAFVTELNPTGTGQVYSTFYASEAGSMPPSLSTYGLAVDPAGEAVIVGSGFYPTLTSNAFCDSPSGSLQGFVAKFNATGTALVYASSLCGEDSQGGAVAVDSTGAAYVTGTTGSPSTFQNILLQPIQSYTAPLVASGFALKLDTSGNVLWASFLAVNNSSQSRIATDPAGDAYILTGPVYSQLGYLPTTPNTIGLPATGLSTNNGPNFLLKIAPSLGAPVPLASPTSETFSAENIGVSSAAVDVQLGNYGDASTSPTLSVSGDFSETDDCSTAIPSGSKCDVNVVFIPTAAGTRTGVLTFNFGGSVPAVTVSLTGTGTAPAATLSTTSLGFGVQAIGTTSGSQQVTVTNSGTGALTITSVQATSQFAATSTCGAPVAPSSSCTIQVTFTPTASGVQAGTLTITDNASNSPQTVSLSGNQPAAFALTSSGGSSSTSATVAPGQTAMYALNLTGSYGFSNAVAFTCAGAPANSTCSVSPNPATVSGTSAIPVTVSIVTQAASASPAARFRDHNDSGRGRYLFGVGFTSMLLATFLSFASGNSRLRKAYFGFTTLLLFGICAGCGGGGSSSSTQPTTPTTPTTPATPAGAYTVTVTGTSGSLTQSMSLTLNVT